MSCRLGSKEFVDSLGDNLSALPKECFVVRYIKQADIGWNTLSFKNRLSCFLKQCGKIANRRLVTDRTIRFTPDECKIRDVVRLARCVVVFQNRLWKNVVKL
jgi:hypothetical protein